MHKTQYRSLVAQMFNDLGTRIKCNLILDVGLDEIRDFEKYSTRDQDKIISFMLRKKFIRTRKEL